MPKRETPLGGGVKRPVIRPAKKSAARKKRSRAGQIAFSVLVFLAVAAVAFFIWARTQGELSVTENAVGSLLSPVQSAMTR